ncbi:hypothetical protein DPMN_148129 [Dreissena polymorpha]|uniref:Uncharacterized protein n=1 Tax=Dreissena polymorpha TaxID=45954 RepID=A0A9D4FA99_DREPO|nr:hypothetical protein DPMN_148129 [Dreissena polymorpha]
MYKRTTVPDSLTTVSNIARQLKTVYDGAKHDGDRQSTTVPDSAVSEHDRHSKTVYDGARQSPRQSVDMPYNPRQCTTVPGSLLDSRRRCQIFQDSLRQCQEVFVHALPTD